MQDTLQSIKKSGNLNPMWGKRHDEETKKKISDAQKKRYAAIRKALMIYLIMHKPMMRLARMY